MAKSNENDVSKLSFEDTIKELTGIVSKIEQGQISLENSIQQYERGMTLIKHCRQILSKAEERIVKISEEN
jgi:exodeoxyribonuclease VII small subunit